MRFTAFFIVSLMVQVTLFAAEGEDAWDYPSGRKKNVGEVAAGRAGELRVFDCETTDSVETVITWYAKKLGLKADHSLMKTAAEGFQKLANPENLSFQIYEDTDKTRHHTQLTAQITPEYAHVTIVHRPDFERPDNLIISIAETPSGASIHLIQTLPESSGMKGSSEKVSIKEVRKTP